MENILKTKNRTQLNLTDVNNEDEPKKIIEKQWKIFRKLAENSLNFSSVLEVEGWGRGGEISKKNEKQRIRENYNSNRAANSGGNFCRKMLKTKTKTIIISF